MKAYRVQYDKNNALAAGLPSSIGFHATAVRACFIRT